jgi:hypothetical protein
MEVEEVASFKAVGGGRGCSGVDRGVRFHTNRLGYAGWALVGVERAIGHGIDVCCVESYLVMSACWRYLRVRSVSIGLLHTNVGSRTR